MKLDRVTLTGADDSCNPNDLLKLSQKYPFVEWGILFVLGGHGNRFPSIHWLNEFLAVTKDHHEVNLCAHLCGGWVDDLTLYGRYNFGYTPISKRFARVQLNFHGGAQPTSAIVGLRNAKRTFLYQVDGVNDDLIRGWCKKGLGSPLFDLSGGAGILPKTWPRTAEWDEATYHGYAGGLGPKNVVEQVSGPIAEAAGDGRIWIDMETRLRSNNDELFDMAKCEEVLAGVEPFIFRA